MKKRTLPALLTAMVLLILDSRCAIRSARDSMELCLGTLIPVLLPLFVLSAIAVPGLSNLRLPWLARLLGIPEGSEGLFVLGCCGGFPLGAAAIAQAVEARALKKTDAERMLGLCSLCGPSFLFGVIGSVLSPRTACLIFAIQLESAFLTAMLLPTADRTVFRGSALPAVSPSEAVRRAVRSMASVCAWVVLAGIADGFLRRWLAPLLPGWGGTVLTGLLELTNGVFSLGEVPGAALRFVLCAGFVCFGGVSVLLQIAGLAGPAGLGMKQCILRKLLHCALGLLLSAGTAVLGPWVLLAGMAPPLVKIAVEISGMMVYNGGRKEGI